MLDARSAFTSAPKPQSPLANQVGAAGRGGDADGQGSVVGRGGALRTVAVLSAGVHEPSTTSALAAGLVASVAAAAEPFGLSIRTRTVEIRDLAGDLAAASVGQATTPELRETIVAVTNADALIAVTPVFAASYTGLFKSFFDVLDPDSLTGMPTVIAATGGSVRHSLVIDHALRPLLAYFRAAVVPTGVFVASDDSRDAAQSTRLARRIERAGMELAAFLAARPAKVALATDRRRS